MISDDYYTGAIFLATFFSVICFFAFYYIKSSKEKEKLEKTFRNYGKPKDEELLEYLIANYKIFAKIDYLLKNSGTRMSHRDFFSITSILFLAGGVFGFYIYSNFFVFLTVGILIGVIPYQYLVMLDEKRLRGIRNDFGEMIMKMSNLLIAGMNISLALGRVHEDLSDPLKSVVEEIARDVLSTGEIEKVLKDAYSRVPIFEFRMFYLLVSIHSDSGGKLAYSLQNLKDILDDKKALKNEVDELTKENKISSYLTAIVPVVLFLGMNLRSNHYMEQFTQMPNHNYILAISFIFIFVGLILVLKFAKIDIGEE